MSIRNTLLAGPMGFGAAPLGNMYRNIPEEEAEATVDAAWAAGTRFFDTAPFYGAGLSKSALARRCGNIPAINMSSPPRSVVSCSTNWSIQIRERSEKRKHL